MLTTIDKLGRVKIPKRIREHIGIDYGTKLNISENNQRIIIEPIKKEIPLVDRDGILVFTGKLEKKRSKLIESDRNKRMRKLLTD